MKRDPGFWFALGLLIWAVGTLAFTIVAGLVR